MKYLFALALLLLSACGCTPMYGNGSLSNNIEITDALNRIEISNIPDRSGQALRNALIDRFYNAGTPSNTTYLLTIAPLIENRSDLDVTIDDEATRRQLRLSTSISFARKDDHNTPTTKRDLYTIVSYNVLQSQFTTRVAEQNARNNAVTDLARQIEQAIIIALRAEATP